MKRFWTLIVLALLFTGATSCRQLMSDEEAAAEIAAADLALEEGNLNEWMHAKRLEDIERMRTFHAFDLADAQALGAAMLTTLLAQLGITRVWRGPGKPIPVAAVPAFQKGAAAAVP